MAALVAFQHDARKGVPPVRVALGEQHPLAQIVALCEAFDAVSSTRPPHEALDFVLTERAHAFDPTLIQVFTALVGRMIAR